MKREKKKKVELKQTIIEINESQETEMKPTSFPDDITSPALQRRSQFGLNLLRFSFYPDSTLVVAKEGARFHIDIYIHTTNEGQIFRFVIAIFNHFMTRPALYLCVCVINC